MKLFAAECRGKEVSLLALLETLVAAAFALQVASRRDSFAIFAVSAAAAPLFLLRTRNSTAHGLRLARGFLRWADREWRPSRLVFAIPFLFVGPLLIRLWATLATLFREPAECLRSIPGNWWNLIAETDVTELPQVVPGFHDTGPGPRVPALWDMRLYAGSLFLTFDRKPNPGRLVLLLFVAFSWLVIVPFTFLPAWLYRWTLKSTFWIYLPLLWVVGPAHFKRDSYWLRLQRIANDQLGVLFSVVVIAMGLVKIRLWQTRAGLAETLDATRLGRFFSDYVAPNDMPAWQYAAIINGVLAIVMYAAARQALNAREEKSPWPERPTDAGFRIATGLRRTLTLYTTLVLILITAKQGFPPLGEWLPS